MAERTVYKAFLSHSSADKVLVRSVADQLNAANTHFDERTFEAGEEIDSEIVAGLDSSDLFVLFYSAASANSRWVKREISLAESRLEQGEIPGILVVRIDDSPITALPAWIRKYLVRTTTSPFAIASQIRGKLLELAIGRQGAEEYFVNREGDQKELRRAIASISVVCPVAIYLSGVDGIGRRSLLKRVARDTVSKHLHFPVQIDLSSNEGDVDCYRRLFYLVEDPRFADAAKALAAYESLPLIDRAVRIAALIDRVAAERSMVLLRGHGSLLTDDGDLQPWLALVISNLHTKGRPALGLIARRMAKVSHQRKHPRIFFWSVASLAKEDSEELLSIWLREMEISPQRDMFYRLLEACSGHPKQIEVTARIARRLGLPALELAFAKFVEDYSSYSRELLDSLSLPHNTLRYLALFVDFRLLTAQDLIWLTGERDDFLGDLVQSLQEQGILEVDGVYLRVPPFLADTIARTRWTLEDKGWLDTARKRFLDRVKTIDSFESLSIDVIEKTSLLALRAGDTSEALLLLRPFVSASHFLRVSHEKYEDEKYAEAAELSAAALEKAYCLTDEAIIEAWRLKGMAEIRNGNVKEANLSINELRGRKERIAKRHAHFLEGFRHRMAGEVDIAEKCFRAAYREGGDRSFHILRELAHCLMVQGRHSEAEQFARKAYETAPQNAHVIDMLLEVLIEIRKDDLSGLSADQEIQGLFGALESSSEAAGRSFYESRMSHYYFTLRHFPDAIKFANDAVAATPKFVPVYFHRARVALAIKDVSLAEKDLGIMDELVRDRATRGDRRNISFAHDVRILLAEAKGDFHRAVDLADKGGHIPVNRLQQIRRDLATSILLGGTGDTMLVNWANAVLSSVRPRGPDRSR
jgi:tetratricopeptide (TPR) repeat protein